MDFEDISLIAQSKLFHRSIALVLKARAKNVFFNIGFSNNILSFRHRGESCVVFMRNFKWFEIHINCIWFTRIKYIMQCH